jgi:uncharacterized integral membrane protein
VSDDDLDLDLDDEPLRPARPKPVAPKPAPAATAAPRLAKAVAATKPGLLQRVSDRVRHPRLTGRTFVTILVILVALWLIAENWEPVRFYFIGLALELPKPIAFILDVVLGAVLMWLWLRRTPGATESEK